MKSLLIILGALCINLAIFLVMENMVNRDSVRLLNAWETQTIDFVRTPIEDQTRTKDRRRKPPPKPEELDRPTADMTDLLSESMELPTPIEALNITNMLGTDGIALGRRLVDGAVGTQVMLEGDLTPVSKIPPRYPPEAQMLGHHGFVEIFFYVRRDGTVADPVVVDALPKGIFDRSALEAVSRWRFRPVIIDGVPTRVAARVVVEYELSD